MSQQGQSKDGIVAASPFVFLAGDIALDFVNTVMVDEGRLIDRVSTPEELTAWVAASGLGGEFGVPAGVVSTVHALAIAVRGVLKTAFAAVAGGEAVPEGAIASLNTVLRAAPGSELTSSAGGLRLRPSVDLSRDATPLPWLLADAGAHLLTGDRAQLLRRCANHDTCVLMFLDTSRSRTRRWCSMELCGNRSKVAAHSARHRTGRSAGSP